MADQPKRTDGHQNYSLEADALRLSPRPDIANFSDEYPNGQVTTSSQDSNTHMVTSAECYQSSPVGDSQNPTPVVGHSTSPISEPTTPMSQIGDSINPRSDSTSPTVDSTSSFETEDSKEPINESSVPTDNPCTVYTRVDSKALPVPKKPHPEWQIDALLVELDLMITTDELNTMKEQFRSTFRKKAIEEMTKPIHLFNLMRQRGFLNANDVIYLQSVLFKLGRKDIMQKVINYSLKNDSLHFEPSDFYPGSGYETVEFHLRIDDGKYDREKITDLRARVAEILCVGICLVSVANVRPSNSLLVIIMLPKMLVDILVEYLDKIRIQDRFAVLGIDRITVGGRFFEIEVSSKPDSNKLDEVVVALQQQLADRDLQLESMRVACNTLEHENTDLKDQLKAKEKKKFRDKEDIQLLIKAVFGEILLQGDWKPKPRSRPKVEDTFTA